MTVFEYEVKNKIAYMTLNRPEKLNVINLEVYKEIVAACESFNEDRNALVAIISGKGKSFCAGADLTGAGPDFLTKIEMMYLHILRMKKPTIAAVHGFCLAQGVGITFCSDIRIAAEDTKFGWPQVKRGISSMSGPAFGAHYLPRNFACEYLFTGEFFGPQEATRFNMINRVVPGDKLISTAEEIAHKIAENAPLSVQATKEGITMGLEVGLEHRLYIGAMIGSRIYYSKDAQEGLRAFEEKRKPVWTGE